MTAREEKLNKIIADLEQTSKLLLISSVVFYLFTVIAIVCEDTLNFDIGTLGYMLYGTSLFLIGAGAACVIIRKNLEEVLEIDE